jgi:hypothetical protein
MTQLAVSPWRIAYAPRAATARRGARRRPALSLNDGPFDLLEFDGNDLQRTTLRKRWRRLADHKHRDRPPEALRAVLMATASPPSAKKRGFAGVVSRSTSWLKVKCSAQHEATVTGREACAEGGAPMIASCVSLRSERPATSARSAHRSSLRRA